METTNEFPQYCEMTLCGILAVCDEGETVFTWEAPFTQDKLDDIRDILCDPEAMRIGFNNLNFDDLILANYGIIVPEENTHDAMLALKTCFPELPSFGLKFNCWYLLGDPHWEEFEMLQKKA